MSYEEILFDLVRRLGLNPDWPLEALIPCVKTRISYLQKLERGDFVSVEERLEHRRLLERAAPMPRAP